MRVHRNAKTTPKMRQLIVTGAQRAGRMVASPRRSASAFAGGEVNGVVASSGRPRRRVVTPASTAARTRQAGRGRDPRPTTDARHGLANQCRAPAAAVNGDAGAGARRTQSCGAARAAAPRSSGTNGRTSAISCTSRAGVHPTGAGRMGIRRVRSGMQRAHAQGQHAGKPSRHVTDSNRRGGGSLAVRESEKIISRQPSYGSISCTSPTDRSTICRLRHAAIGSTQNWNRGDGRRW